MARARTAQAKTRQTIRTVLIVGEGQAEEVFVKHVRHIYLGSRSSGLRLTVKNAKGKGGRHVLDYARRQRHIADFDDVAVLLDTDTDWTDADRRAARDAKVTVIESSPCLEAVLLRLKGQTAPLNSAACKQQFSNAFGFLAHDPRVYERHFPKNTLDLGRVQVQPLDHLLGFIGC
jgi:hypothetical protein